MKKFLSGPLSNVTAIVVNVLLAVVLIVTLGAPLSSPDTLALDSGTSNFGNVTLAGNLSVSGTTTLATGEIGSSEIADTTRIINVPLYSFIDCQTDAGAAIGFDTTADALADFVNSATDGTGFTLRFDDTGSTEDQNMEVCSQFTVPGEYASGGQFRIRADKDADTGATEVLNVGVSVNGAALQTAGTATTSGSTTATYMVTPTIAALAGWDAVSFYISVTSDGTMNDVVDLQSVAFVYTASQ